MFPISMNIDITNKVALSDKQNILSALINHLLFARVTDKFIVYYFIE